jgi:hypothetical protein
MTPERKEKMLEHLKDSQEMATSKQLWVINDLCLKYGHQYSLPLTKYEACLIVNQLKQKDELKEIQTILDDRQEIKTVIESDLEYAQRIQEIE